MAARKPAALFDSPTALWIALIAVSWVLDWLYPLPFVPLRFSPIASGGILILIGFGIVALALHEFRDAEMRVVDFDTKTFDPSAALVTTGIFRVSRNPIYIGLHVALIGMAVAFDSLWVLAAILPFHLVLRAKIVPREEAELERAFGESYLDYKSRVRRWL